MERWTQKQKLHEFDIDYFHICMHITVTCQKVWTSTSWKKHAATRVKHWDTREFYPKWGIKLLHCTNYNDRIILHIINNLNAPLTENQKPSSCKTNASIVCILPNYHEKHKKTTKYFSKIHIIEQQTIYSTRSTISTHLSKDQQPPAKQNTWKHD